ncbi:MAG: response regulator transcription factor [Crocinitomicaceae bacterium]|nr:response regulator transcription factor [Crocinitomicaceae bacterium]
MKVLIVDDEFYSRRVIRKILSEAFPELIFLNDAGNVAEAIEIINEDNPDLLLLDIQLKGDLSFNILKSISLDNRQIIFITAYDQYAMDAFDVGASNYILKPIEKEKLINAVRKVQTYVDSERSNGKGDSNQSNGQIEKLIVPGNGCSKVIEVANLKYIAADGVYCKLYTSDGDTTLITKPLSFIEEKLKDHPHFCRIHKSYLINLSYVDNISNDGRNLTLVKSIILPISRARKNEIKSLINQRFY